MSSNPVEKVLGTKGKGRFFVISAPAGAGKTTLVDRLISEFPCIKRSVTCTTREARKGEIEGEHYFFLTSEKFNEMIEKKAFLEHVKLFKNSYGTPKQWILEQKDEGNHVILVIDTQGAMKIKETLDATLVFISPPSLEVLRQRLLHRKTESSKSMENRLSEAEREMEMMDNYDYNIVNEDLETAYQVLRSVFIAEEHRILSHL
jgi:guanylate kinase